MTEGEIIEAFEEFMGRKRNETDTERIILFQAGITARGCWERDKQDPKQHSLKLIDGVFSEEYIGPTPNFGDDYIVVLPGADEATKEKLFELAEASLKHDNRKPSKGITADCGSVDGKNPGIFEYRLVDIETKSVLITVQIPGITTNNLAEYLAAVHAVGWVKSRNLNLPVFSDSRTALSWIRKKVIKSSHVITDHQQMNMVDDASKFVRTFSKREEPLFWNTVLWGDIPADFGNKKPRK